MQASVAWGCASEIPQSEEQEILEPAPDPTAYLGQSDRETLTPTPTPSLTPTTAAQVQAPAMQGALNQPLVRESSSPPPAQTAPGIETVSLRPTAGGYMLDYRYRITNSRLAESWLSHAPPPYLEIPATGEKLMVPASPKIGPLRQQIRPGSTPKEGRLQFVLFANPGQRIASGQVVRVVLGDRFQDMVVVQ